MPNPVSHFEVVGKDAKGLWKFYEAAFGWKVDPVMPDVYAMAYPGSGINGGIGANPPDAPGPAGVTWYVEVDSLDKSLEQIGKLGGKTVMPPMDVPEGPRIAKFADPEGNVIGLVEARPEH